MSHLAANKTKLLARVRRLAGQMAAIEKAITEDAGCAIILHQVAGVRGYVSGLIDELIEDLSLIHI